MTTTLDPMTEEQAAARAMAVVELARLLDQIRDGLPELDNMTLLARMADRLAQQVAVQGRAILTMADAS